MPPKQFNFDWFNVVKTAALAVAAVAVLWLNTNYAAVADLQKLETKVSEIDREQSVQDEKLKSVVELINTKLEYIMRDTEEIKKKLEIKEQPKK